jgi:hypothetical protein
MTQPPHVATPNAHALRVYVGGAVPDVHRVRMLMRAIESAGHEVLCDWTTLAYREPYVENRQTNQPLAAAMLEAATSCDVFVLADHPALRGGLIECGMALAHGRSVIVSGMVRESIFFTLPNLEFVATDHHVVAALADVKRHAE